MAEEASVTLDRAMAWEMDATMATIVCFVPPWYQLVDAQLASDAFISQELATRVHSTVVFAISLVSGAPCSSALPNARRPVQPALCVSCPSKHVTHVPNPIACLLFNASSSVFSPHIPPPRTCTLAGIPCRK